MASAFSSRAAMENRNPITPSADTKDSRLLTGSCPNTIRSYTATARGTVTARPSLRSTGGSTAGGGAVGVQGWGDTGMYGL